MKQQRSGRELAKIQARDQGQQQPQQEGRSEAEQAKLAALEQMQAAPVTDTEATPVLAEAANNMGPALDAPQEEAEEEVAVEGQEVGGGGVANAAPNDGANGGDEPQGEEDSGAPELGAAQADQAADDGGGDDASADGEAAPTDGGGGGGSADSGGGDTPLPPAPPRPAAPPEPELPPAPELSGSPSEVMNQFAQATPTNKARVNGDLGQAMNESVQESHNQMEAEPLELTAVLNDEPAQESANQTIEAPAADTGAIDGTQDQSAPTVEDNDVQEANPDLSTNTGSMDRLSDESSEASKARAVEASLSSAPTANPGVRANANAPALPTDGKADPRQANTAAEQAKLDALDGLGQAQQAVHDGPGPEVVQLTSLEETVAVPNTAAPEFGDIAENADMADYLGWGLPNSAMAAFDEQQGAMMATAVGEAQNQVAQAETDWVAGREEIAAESATKVDDANKQAQAQQEAAVTQGRADIAAEQKKTLDAQKAKVTEATGNMEAERAKTVSDIDSRSAAEQAKINAQFDKAQADSDKLVAEGEAQAQRKEEQARKDAESDSWWDRAVSAVSDAISSVVDAICAVWEEIRSAIHAIMEAAVDFANAVIDGWVAIVSTIISAYYDFVRLVIEELLAEAFPELAAALLEAVDAIESMVLSAVQSIGEFAKSAVATIADWALAAIDGLISAIQAGFQMAGAFLTAVVTGDWEAVADMALRALLAAAGIPYDDFMGTMGKAMESWDLIIANPGILIDNSVDALVQGVSQFGENFMGHFAEGAIEWITGAQDIELPESFGIEGIFDITTQILGIDMGTIEDKAREHVGDEAVDAVLFVVDYVQAFMDDGIAGIWELIKDQMGDLMGMVIGAISTWLVEKAILVGARWIASAFTGVGLILEALIAAWQFMMWVVDQMAAMWGIVDAVVGSVHDFVTGNIGPAANKIEDAMADMIPVAIDLVAKLLNISNIADKVQGIVEGVREMIDSALDWAFETALGMFGVDSKKKKEGPESEEEGDIGEEINFTANGEGHKLWVDDAGQVKVASTVMTVEARLNDWDDRVAEAPSQESGKGGVDPDDHNKAYGLIREGRSALGLVQVEVQEATRARGTENAQGENADVANKERGLAAVLEQLFKLFTDDCAADDPAMHPINQHIGTQVVRRNPDGDDPKPALQVADYVFYTASNPGGGPKLARVRKNGSSPNADRLQTVHIDEDGYLRGGSASGKKDVDPSLKACINRGNIREFLIGMANGGTYTANGATITLAQFNTLWGQAEDRNHIKTVYRAFVPGGHDTGQNHEFVPCASMNKLINDMSAADDAVARRWILFAADARTDTKNLVFVDDHWKGGVPSGHVGAVRLNGSFQTSGTEAFHTACENAIGATPAATAKELIGVVDDYISDGSEFDDIDAALLAGDPPALMQKGNGAFPTAGEQSARKTTAASKIQSALAAAN